MRLGLHFFAVLAATAFLLSAQNREKWLLRFSLREGSVLTWHVRIVTKKLVDKKAEFELTEIWLREQVEQIRPNGNLVWSSQVTRCTVNGEVIPASQFDVTTSELTPLGYPSKPITIPPPSINQIDDWLVDLFGSLSLVLPATEVGIGDNWHYQLSVGLKHPNEPRRLTLTYKLERMEKVGEKDCLKISTQVQSPVKLAWQWKDASVIVTGGAKLEGVFWFDPAIGFVRQRKVRLSVNYTLESERWDGFQFVQRTSYVNQTTEVEARLLSPK
ncbi:MAG: hypothetical protein NZ805_07140 [Armatimonadetes bacterium]|nr:hypothetical protein [Armatimonadota bacterium]MDW8028297.1 hypothetical protein [Armatimonadota bacterium]